MYALKFSYKDQTLDLKKVTKPVIKQPDDILIKIAYAGVSASDYYILSGKYTSTHIKDVTLGQELVGVISDVGHDVIHFQEGDRVGVYPKRSCRLCEFCRSGKQQFCKRINSNTIGILKDGGWAQFVICSEEQVFRLPPFLPFEQAVLTEAVSTIIRGYEQLTPLLTSHKIFIIGAGTIGCLWAASLHMRGHRNVTISEPNTFRLDTLRKLNTGYTLITPEQLEADPDKYVFDVIIDCSGDASAVEFALKLLNFGGRFLQYGIVPRPIKIKIRPFDFFWKELQMFGVKSKPDAYRKALDVIEAMGDRYLNYNSLGIQIFTLSDYKDAIEAFKTGKILKAIFKM